MVVPWVSIFRRAIISTYLPFCAPHLMGRKMPPAKLLGAFFISSLILSCALSGQSPASPSKYYKPVHRLSHQHPAPKITPKNTKKAHPIAKTTKETTQLSTALPSKAYHQLSLQERLANIESQIQKAQTTEETITLLEHAETLRFHSLNAASRLLVDEAKTQMEALHPNEAVNALDAALAMQPDNALLHRQRAQINLAANDPFGAIDDLAFTLQQDPHDPTAWLLLTQAENNIHNDQIALSTFAKALESAPHLPQKGMILEELQKKAYGQED